MEVSFIRVDPDIWNALRERLNQMTQGCELCQEATVNQDWLAEVKELLLQQPSTFLADLTEAQVINNALSIALDDLRQRKLR